MNPSKLSYAEGLKNQSEVLNPRMGSRPLIPKAPRVRLGKEAVQKLHSFIHGEPKPEAVNSATPHQVEALEKKGGRPPKVPEKKANNQPLVLARASTGILPSFVVDEHRFMQSSVNSAGVSLMKPNELENIVIDGAQANPIDIEDDSEVEIVEPEELTSVDHYSVDGLDVVVHTSEFDANEFFNEVVDETTNTHTEEAHKETLELNRMMRVDVTKSLRKAKRRMEESFMDNYAMKMKSMKRDYRDEYEGEYNFIVKLGVVDNVVEVKETVTYCKVVQLEDKRADSDDDYKPESEETESMLVVDEKRRQMNRDHLCFDPEKQVTNYNTKCLPIDIEVVCVNEKPSQTATYTWLSRYESVPSNSLFNKFLNDNFKHPHAYPGNDTIAEFEGVRYRYLRVGTNNKKKPVKQYNQFVIGNNFTIYRLGMNGSPTVNLGVNATARERRFPEPINNKFTIASLFWSNGLLKSQKSW